MSGPSGSGRTSFVRRFLRKLRDLYTETKFAGGIVWFYGEKSAVPSSLPAYIRLNKGEPENFDSVNGKTSPVILDDLLTYIYSKQVCELFTRGCHHRNISVILITQNLFHKGRFCRDISLNAHYIVTLKNVRDKKQFTHLANQVYPEYSLCLYNAYLDATQLPYGYPFLDLTQNTNDGLRFRTHIFPDEGYPLIVYSCVGNEASEDELLHSSGAEDGRSEIA